MFSLFLDMNPYQSIAKKNQDTVLSTLEMNGDFLSRNLSTRTRTMKSQSNQKCKKLIETHTIRKTQETHVIPSESKNDYVCVQLCVAIVYYCIIFSVIGRGGCAVTIRKNCVHGAFPPTWKVRSAIRPPEPQISTRPRPSTCRASVCTRVTTPVPGSGAGNSATIRSLTLTRTLSGP